MTVALEGLSKAVANLGLGQLKQNLCLKRYLTDKTRFRVRESQAFLQMQSLVRKFEADCKDRSSKLELKKEKSFARSDSDKWEMDPDVAKTIDKKNRKQAWEAMYPKESAEVRRISDESQYFID